MNADDVEMLRKMWRKDMQAPIQGLRPGPHASGLTIRADGRVGYASTLGGGGLVSWASKSTAQTFTAGSTSIIDYATVQQDTLENGGLHITTGASWVFTSRDPQSTIYYVYASVMVYANGNAYSAGDSLELVIYSGGSRSAQLAKYDFQAAAGATSTAFVHGGGVVSLNNSGTINIRLINNSSASRTVQNSASNANASLQNRVFILKTQP